MIPSWSTGCPDWKERLLEGRPLIPFAPLFPAEASAAMEVFKALRVVDVPGVPTFGECSRDWSLDFPQAIFGAYDPINAKRLIREYFLLVSKKNAKSTNAAGIMLTALMRNWRRSAEFLIIAPTVEVANNSFYPARDAIKEDPELMEMLKIKEHVKEIEHRVTGATLKVIAADADTVSGKKASGVLVEELWLFGKRNNAESMLREATGGLVSRPEGFVVYVSTHSDEPPTGVFKQKLERFRNIRDGKIIDNRSLPVFYEYWQEAIDKKLYLLPKYWKITNPNLGLSVDEEWISDKLQEAQDNGPTSLNIFIAKHLNVQVGQSMLEDNWAGAEYWNASEDELVDIDYLLKRCEVISVGVDGGGLDDLFSVAAVGRERETGRWLSTTLSLCNRVVLTKRKSESSKLLDFEKDGDLYILNTIGEDIPLVVEFIKRIDDSGLLDRVGMDAYGVGSIIDALAEVGISGDRVVAISQGFKLMGAILTTERKLADGTLKHSKQPIMSWAVHNAKTEQKGNAKLITKQKSGTAKIDPLMALFDAVSLMSENPESKSSIYGVDRGLLVFG